MRIFSTLLLLSVSGMLAGCNPEGGLYSQGPWGRVDGQRHYPGYSAPWGGRIRDSRLPLQQEAPRPPGTVPVAQGPGTLTGPSFYQRDTGLPADPQPAAPGTAVFSLEAAPASNEQARKEVPVQTPSPPASSPEASPPGVFTAPRRASSYAGTWKATDGRGNSCAIHLSSVASLDLYKASVSKCPNGELRDVNLWKFEENRIALFSRGAEIARLEGSEASLSGTLNKSGAPLKMLR